ncbi:MAG: DUF4340 domain-containing protein, partial [Gammaproteobacteria bacterium]|nr:DUF4340 domain-containing protein [Gammaproteobacteria bacterium]
MKKHHLGVLVASAVLAIVAAFWASSVREPVVPENISGTPLLPGLSESVNDVSGLRLVGAGNETFATLTRGEKTWNLTEKSGYRANVADVRELLFKLSQAKLLEEKTSNPAYYSRLGVQSVDAADAAGVRVELEGVSVPAIIVGNWENAREAVYVRRADEATSWLVSGVISISKDTLQWLDRQALDVNPGRIAEVEIAHPDGETVLISKSAFGQANFDVENIPAGRELKRESIANDMASVVENLRADDVLSLANSGFADLKTTRVSYRAFDGFVVHADVATKDDQYYAHFSAATNAEVAARYQPTPEAAEADAVADAADLGPVAGPAPATEPDLGAVAEEA